MSTRICLAILATLATNLNANASTAAPPPPADPPTGFAAAARLGPVLNQLATAWTGPRAGVSMAGLEHLVDRHGQVDVVVEVAPDHSLAAVATALGTLEGAPYASDARGLVFARLPVAQLPAAASLPGVQRIRRPHHAEPSVVSEGVALHAADAMHTQGLTGAGTKVAVLDCGGFTGYQSLLGIELPSAVTLWPFGGNGGADPVGTGVHGTGCAEIVYDMAPGATMLLAHDLTEADFYAAVDWLIAQQVDIVSYSCSWLGSFPYDGSGLPYNTVDAAVEDARAAGILWVNSAGNYADDDSYHAFFVDADGGGWHDFDPSGAWAVGVGYMYAGSTYYMALTWDDWPADPTTQGATIDHQLVLYSWDGVNLEQVATSWNPQTGAAGELPFEEIEYTAPADGWYYLGIWSPGFTGSSYLSLRKTQLGAFSYHNPQHSVAVPGDSPAALTVAAVHWTDSSLEPFSSRGPALGPGGTDSGGLVKPDLAGADGTSGVTYGLSDGQPWLTGSGFFGTSASCPHVAGGAALLLDADAASGPDELQARLELTAADLGPLRKDSMYGAGRMALDPGLLAADGLESGDTIVWSATVP